MNKKEYEKVISALKKIDFSKHDELTLDDEKIVKRYIKESNDKLCRKQSYNINKEQLFDVITKFYTQTLHIKRAMDSFNVLVYEKKKRSEIYKDSGNFFYISQKALGFYTVTMMAALLKESLDKKEITVHNIIGYCKDNLNYFDNNEQVEKICDVFFNDISKHEKLISNLKVRRDKTCCHNDKECFFFSKKIAEEYELNLDEFQSMLNVLHNFSKELYSCICDDFKQTLYPSNTDDALHLFGEKTGADIWIEGDD